MNIYPSQLARQLDFPVILEKLSTYCVSKPGVYQIQHLIPSKEFEEVLQKLKETNEALLAMHQGNGLPHQSFPELQIEIKLLAVQHAVLNAGQFNQLRLMVSMSHDLLVFLHEKKEAFPVLFEKIHRFSYLHELIEEIENVFDKEGQVKDGASPTLQQIRLALLENRKTSDRIYRNHIQRLSKSGQLADIEESYINGRRVLAVLAEFKREIKGMIHDHSASGKITFIEPNNAIELNNEKLDLEDAEKKEIYTILKALTGLIQPYRHQIQEHLQNLISFDVICAKAKLGKILQATLPQIQEEEPVIHLINAYHPVLWLQNQEAGLNTVPVNCKLDEINRILVISGPNAGGKSIALKTIGLFQLMLQCGLLLPTSAKSSFVIKETLLGDIGDNQSIEDGLSTYSSRLIKMKYFLEHAGPKALFLIDEFGTGSDPDMGGALAEIILNKLNASKAQGVVTTHFTNLKLLANQEEGIFNGCMLFNSRTLKPLYQLQIGEPGSSFTFEVASKIGLPENIIEEARQKISAERIQMDKLLHQLQQEKNTQIRLKRDLIKQMGKATAEKREFRELNDQLEDKIAKTNEQKEEKQKLMEFGRKLMSLTQEWTQNKNKKEVIHKFVKLAGYEQQKKKLQEEFERSETFRQIKISEVKEKIQVGSAVRMLKSRETGIVFQMDEKKAVVRFGRVDIQVGLEKLEVVAEKNMNKAKANQK
ncbi:MAG: endonuclease MutS2 [Chitinophagaceae bacterium]|jgi:DNA mismatch repair protein MutS2